MIKMTCKCGKSTVEFQYLSAKDFPDGLEQECCLQGAPPSDDPQSEVTEIVQEVVEEVNKEFEKPNDNMPTTKGRKSKKK